MPGRPGEGTSNNPLCEHGLPCKMVQVKKDGPNKVGQ